jgi:hypothetical protein
VIYNTIDIFLSEIYINNTSLYFCMTEKEKPEKLYEFKEGNSLKCIS